MTDSTIRRVVDAGLPSLAHLEGFKSLGGPVRLAGWPHPLKQYSSRSKVNMDDDKIKEFCNITGAGAQVAEQLLQVCNGNLEMAINMHMEGQLHKS